MHRFNFIDLHCHPNIKPYGQSFNHGFEHSQNPADKNSIWYQDRPGIAEKIFEILFPTYTQSDFSTVYHGGVDIIGLSLYSIERSFFTIRGSQGKLADLALNIASGVGNKRVDFVQEHNDYYQDIFREYRFVCAGEGKEVKLPGNAIASYKIINSFSDIEWIENFNSDPENQKRCHRKIGVVLDIEGAHIFNQSADIVDESSAPIERLRTNIRHLKNVHPSDSDKWQHRLSHITLMHHFSNDLGGHAQSLPGIVGNNLLNQKPALGDDLSELGKEAVRLLLSTENGYRIPICIKHMSVKSRYSYYNILEEDFKGEAIPIIVSHGAVNGKNNPQARKHLINSTKGCFRFNEDEPLWDINFYDEELLKIADSKGIFGFQLDQRRLASGRELKQRISKHKNLQLGARHLWKNIQHTAQVLDNEGRPGWDIQAIGSDFDGIINPLNGYRTAERLEMLETYLLTEAKGFLNSSDNTLRLPENRNMDAELAVSKVLFQNALDFYRRNL